MKQAGNIQKTSRTRRACSQLFTFNMLPWAHLAAIGCNGIENCRLHLAAIGCIGLTHSPTKPFACLPGKEVVLDRSRSGS